MTGRRFVAIPADAMLGELRAIGAKVSERGGSFAEDTGRGEIIVDIIPPGARCIVRVFTSIPRGGSEVRDCGEDAVRVVVCVRDATGHRSLEPTEKVLRTAPRGMADSARVEAFLGRLRDRVRDAYRLAAKRPLCPLCGRAMARRKTKSDGREFFGCIGYPECRGTVPINS